MVVYRFASYSYLSNQDLFTLINRQIFEEKRPFTEREVRHVVRQICEAIQWLHRKGAFVRLRSVALHSCR